MLTRIFTSNARVRLLRLFMLNPENEYYLRQAERNTNLPYTAVRRELSNLTSLGLFKFRQNSQRRYYQVDKNFFLYPELRGIMLKTVGLSRGLENKLASQKDMKLVFIFGSYAKNEETTISDIDLFVIGKITSKKLHQLLEPIEDELGRDINYLSLSEKEIRSRLENKDHFITSVFKEPKFFLKGSEDELKELVKSRKS